MMENLEWLRLENDTLRRQLDLAMDIIRQQRALADKWERLFHEREQREMQEATCPPKTL